MAHKKAQRAIKSAMAVWDEVYGWALKKGSHNPQGTEQRAQTLTSLYMKRWARKERLLESFQPLELWEDVKFEQQREDLLTYVEAESSGTPRWSEHEDDEPENPFEPGMRH